MEQKYITEAVSGSREAFCRLYGLYKDKLYRYALYRLGNPEDAEDAVSDCVLAAWQSIGKLRSSEAFAPWIFSILRTCCAGRIKETIRSRESFERMTKESAADSGGSPASLSAELCEALGSLRADEREIVLLSVLGDLNSKEIAAATGLTPGSVRSKLSRSLAKMRSFLS